MPFTRSKQLTLERTPHYLAKSLFVPERVYQYNPKIKLIVIIRDPSKRAISHYTNFLGRSNITIESNLVFDKYSQFFEQTILYENGSISESNQNIWLQHGIYIKHIKNWLKYFPIEQFLFLDGGNLILNPYDEVKKLEKFLNLRDYIQKDHFVYDDSKGFYCMNKTVKSIITIHCLGEHKGRMHPFISQSIKDKLKDFYRPFDKELFELINQKPFWSL